MIRIEDILYLKGYSTTRRRLWYFVSDAHFRAKWHTLGQALHFQTWPWVAFIYILLAGEYHSFSLSFWSVKQPKTTCLAQVRVTISLKTKTLLQFCFLKITDNSILFFVCFTIWYLVFIFNRKFDRDDLIKFCLCYCLSKFDELRFLGIQSDWYVCLRSYIWIIIEFYDFLTTVLNFEQFWWILFVFRNSLLRAKFLQNRWNN